MRNWKALLQNNRLVYIMKTSDELFDKNLSHITSIAGPQGESRLRTFK